uniref:THAP-type domain-containing protein n=1 Tax=Amphimedon queenslandica TaxID=400682 RepID=A0A1X7TI06_AMPQE
MIEHDDHSVTVNQNTHQDLFSIMQHHHNEITKAFPEDSFPYIFWMSQYKAATRSASPTGMRWNPAMIRWCVYLQQKSSTAYELLRKSKCLHLPSQRTLREYIHHNKPGIGFSNELDEQLVLDSKLQSLESHQKYVGIIADEMYIKQGLVYDKTTGDLVGYCRIGEINDHLLQLEREYTESNGDAANNTHTLAKTMLVLMIRGLFTSLTFPYASFATSNLTGEQMVPIFYEGIMRIERCGFKVLTITLDGCSVNRKFMQIVSNPDTTVPHKFKNPLSNNSREIFLFSDPSHLIKTARNCLANQSRNMQYNGNPISWKFIVKLYHIITESTGLTVLPKIKYEHVFLTNFSKMRVDLAAQVLSQSVATALRTYLKGESEETAKYIEMFDRIFDSLNVTNYTTCYTKRKYFQSPYRWNNDLRIKWMQFEFLPWLKNWEDQVKSKEDLKAREKNNLIISQETLLGIRITAYSFIDLLKCIFTIPGVKPFLS